MTMIKHIYNSCTHCGEKTSKELKEIMILVVDKELEFPHCSFCDSFHRLLKGKGRVTRITPLLETYDHNAYIINKVYDIT